MQNGSLREEESRSYLITLSILCNKVSITSFHSRFLRDSASTHPYQNHHSNQQQSQCCVSNTFRHMYALRIKPHLNRMLGILES